MKRKTTKQFIKEAKLVHGDKYDYSLVNYKNTHSKVEIICNEHGNFMQEAKSHLYGSGCMACHRKDTRKRLQYDNDDFIRLATEKHSDRYNYSLINYIDSNNKVEIICSEHGIFKMLPSSHTSKGQGCPKCGQMVSGLRLTTEEFIQKSNIIHNNRFDYSLVNYKNNRTPVIIICPEHGEFKQQPGYHQANTISCPDCVSNMRSKNGIGGYSPAFFKQHSGIKNKPALLYVVKIYNENEFFIKVGITTRSLDTRFSKLNSINYTFKSIYTREIPLYSAFIKEQEILVAFKDNSYIPQKKFDGWTECFFFDTIHDIISYLGQ